MNRFRSRGRRHAGRDPGTVAPVTNPLRKRHMTTASDDGGPAVEVRGLTKRFGARTAVDNVDLLVPRGVAFGYLGPNGAGKTTLIRVLLGLTRADRGTMSLLGVPVPAQRGRALARVGAIVDEPRFHGHLTGRENLKILAAARGGRRRAADRPGAGPDPADPAGRRQGRRLLHGHAPAPGPGRLPAGRPAAAHPRRADERTGSGRHARDAGHDPRPGRRGTDGHAVLAPAG